MFLFTLRNSAYSNLWYGISNITQCNLHSRSHHWLYSISVQMFPIIFDHEYLTKEQLAPLTAASLTALWDAIVKRVHQSEQCGALQMSASNEWMSEQVNGLAHTTRCPEPPCKYLLVFGVSFDEIEPFNDGFVEQRLKQSLRRFRYVFRQVLDPLLYKGSVTWMWMFNAIQCKADFRHVHGHVLDSLIHFSIRTIQCNTKQRNTKRRLRHEPSFDKSNCVAAQFQGDRFNSPKSEESM